MMIFLQLPLFFLLLLLPTLLSSAFVVVVAPTRFLISSSNNAPSSSLFLAAESSSSSTTNNNNNDSFDVTLDLPPSGSNIQVNMKINSVLSVPSELIEVRYEIPFGLDVEPKKGLAVVTGDGAAKGGEKVNDVLRYSSQWTMGLPRGEGGIQTTVAAFSGAGLGWQCSMFDVMKAQVWEEVVEALTSNTPGRTDEVVLLFERPLEGVAPELQ